MNPQKRKEAWRDQRLIPERVTDLPRLPITAYNPLRDPRMAEALRRTQEAREHKSLYA